MRLCKHRIVFAPKRRRKTIYNQYRESVDAMPHRFCPYKGVEIIKGHLIPNHARMLMSILSKMSGNVQFFAHFDSRIASR